MVFYIGKSSEKTDQWKDCNDQEVFLEKVEHKFGSKRWIPFGWIVQCISKFFIRALEFCKMGQGVPLLKYIFFNFQNN